MNTALQSAHTGIAQKVHSRKLYTPGAEKTSSRKRIYFRELDGLRFFAFLMVFMLHHSLFSKTPYFSALYKYGWVGVDLFFVLSSFLFTKLLIAEYEKTKTISIRKFYLRRIFRIWPIYFLIVGLAFLGLIFKHDAITKDIWTRLAGLLTFSDNIISAIKGFNFSLPFVLHLWTIGYEEQFYILIPVIIPLLARSSFKVRIVCLLFAVLVFNIVRVLLIANKTPYPAVYVLPVTHFESIILGIVIGFGDADLVLKRINPLLLGLTGVLFFFLLYLLPMSEKNMSDWDILSYSLAGLSTALVLYSVLASNYLKRIFSKKILVFLGKRSYGLYIYHLLCISLANYLTMKITVLPSTPLLLCLCSLAFTILMAIVSYEIIEKPFLKLKKKFEVIASRPV